MPRGSGPRIDEKPPPSVLVTPEKTIWSSFSTNPPRDLPPMTPSLTTIQSSTDAGEPKSITRSVTTVSSMPRALGRVSVRRNTVSKHDIDFIASSMVNDSLHIARRTRDLTTGRARSLSPGWRAWRHTFCRERRGNLRGLSILAPLGYKKAPWRRIARACKSERVGKGSAF